MKPRRRWEDSVKICLKGIGCEDEKRIVTQDKDKWRTLPKTVANKSLSFRKDEKFLDHLCDYGSSQRLLR
jgi:hypothetical protein